MSKRAGSSMRRIVRKRNLPGMLLFDSSGHLLSSNPVADQLLSHGEPIRLLQKIRSSLRTLKTTGLKKRDGATVSPAGPLLRDTFSSGRRTYGLQAFLLNHRPAEQPPLIAVLFERINPSRLQPGKAQRRFGLSPREIDVVEALKIGMSDKEIASSLGVGFETVRDYLKSIRSKLGVSTRTAILNALLPS